MNPIFLAATALVTAVGLAPPAAAQMTDRDECAAIWSRFTGSLGDATANARPVSVVNGWCRVADIRVSPPGEFKPTWFADQMTFRGTGLAGPFDFSVAPEALELQVKGMRLVPQMGDPRLDYAYRIRALDGKFDGELAASWDRASRTVNLSRLVLDFQGDNQIEVSAKISNIDLSSRGKAQASATGFAVTEADVMVTTHGLFETLFLMPLATVVLPETDDVEGAVAELKRTTADAIVRLPPETFSADSKEALTQLLNELPTPNGTLTIALRSAAGVGPVRLARYVMVGVPKTMEELAPVFDDVKIDVTWKKGVAPQ